MKTQEELKIIKEELENLNKKLSELSEDELQQVVGGDVVEGGFKVRIRGIGTINSNDPICIIDSVPSEHNIFNSDN